jgi:hypothetical protein
MHRDRPYDLQIPENVLPGDTFLVNIPKKRPLELTPYVHTVDYSLALF